MTIKNASSIILLRYFKNNYHVLMGKRNSKSKFMPNMYVFPGGAHEKDDGELVKDIVFKNESLLLLKVDSSLNVSKGLPATAIRELWEETGLRIASKKNINNLSIPKTWNKFCNKQFFPNFEGLDFFFRAITPPGRRKRYDARFFLCNSEYILGDTSNFKSKNDELFDLSWLTFEEAYKKNLPRITRKVLDHIQLVIKNKNNLKKIPYYRGGSEKSTNNFITLSGVKILNS